MNKTPKILLNILIGAVVGGLAGASILFGKNGGFLPSLHLTLAFIPSTASGAMIGAIIGGGTGGLLGFRNWYQDRDNLAFLKENGVKIQLHSEELAIAKKWLQTGDVKVHKEVSTVAKTITVPITRTDLVVERSIIHDHTPHLVETLRIPLSDERVEVFKRPVQRGKVAIYRHRFEQFEHIEATLKKERIQVTTDGECPVIDSEVKY